MIGAINKEFAQNYRDQVIGHAQAICSKLWLRVTDIRGWELGGPEVIPPLNELMHWCENHRLAHSINIVSLPHMHTYMLDQMMNDVARNSERHLVEEPVEAFQLLDKLGHPLTPAQQSETQRLWQSIHD